MKTTTITHKIVGIDLGTCNSVASYYDETGTPRVVPINGENITRSVTYFSQGLDETIVGKSACNMRALEPDRVIEYAKRDVGSDKVYFTDGTTQITPCLVQAEQLKYIKEQIVQHFGDTDAGSKAVITVPVNANEAFRQPVITSAECAGIEVLALINEPTAAAIDNGFSDHKGDRLLVVVDFGGGTCDVSIGVMSAGQLTILSSLGDNHLGGRDINDLLLAEVLKRFKDEHGLEISPTSHPHDFYEIEEEVERQKIMLSSKSKVRFVSRVDGATVDFTMTRDELNQLAAPVIQKIEALAKESLAASDVEIDDIDHVLFVGGSTRLKCFREWAERFFGADKLFDSKVSPDLTVSQGAAVHAVKTANEKHNEQVVTPEYQAIPLPELNHKDVTANSLGVAVTNMSGQQEQLCSVILPRNSQIPAKETKTYASCSDNQTQFQVSVLQGEEGNCVNDCLVVGEAFLTLPARSTQTDSIEVTMGYDSSGMVTVTVFDKLSMHTEDITVDFSLAKAS